jgi:hypothetical protein
MSTDIRAFPRLTRIPTFGEVTDLATRSGTAGRGEGLPVDCPGGKFTMNATTLDASGWADMRAWLRDEDNVRRLLAEWEQEENSVENSVAARLEASAANIKRLRDDMDSLGDAIAETRSREARQSLQDKLEMYADRLRKEEAKHERLMTDASDAATRAQEARDIREWVSAVASHADSFTRLEQVTVLHALDAQVTIWRADHVHEDGWPQRYKIVLHFTGFTGQPVTLPPAHSESEYK